MAPAALREQGHHLCSPRTPSLLSLGQGQEGTCTWNVCCSTGSRDVQVGNVLLNPYLHPKNISMNATASAQKGQGSSPQRRHCSVRIGSSTERGRLLGQAGRGDQGPQPLGHHSKKSLRGEMKFSPSTSLLHTATFQKFNVNMQ